MKVIYTVEFIKQYKKLPGRIKSLAIKKEKLFSYNPHNPSLRTHKSAGPLEGYLSFYVNYKYRILFRYGVGDIIYFVGIGGLEVYK